MFVSSLYSHVAARRRFLRVHRRSAAPFEFCLSSSVFQTWLQFHLSEDNGANLTLPQSPHRACASGSEREQAVAADQVAHGVLYLAELHVSTPLALEVVHGRCQGREVLAA